MSTLTKVKLCLLITFTFLGEGMTRKVEWTDGDTIIVEATREEDSPNTLLHRNDIPFFYHAPIPSLQRKRGHAKGHRMRRNIPGKGFVQTCYSVLGDQGHCTTFQQCFPMLYYMEGESKGQIKHPVLAELLLSTSGPCQPPPLSFRDDFVPYVPTEDDLLTPTPDLDHNNKKDLICCPSSKSTPIPPSGEFSKVTPTHLLPYIERLPMRTTPSTVPPVIKSTVKTPPLKVGNAPDAVAGFAQFSTTGDSVPPRESTATFKPAVPSVGQWGHRIPTRSTTPLPPIIDDNNFIESDESEEEKEFIVKFSTTTSPPPPKKSGNDASAPNVIITKPIGVVPSRPVDSKLTFPPPSGSVAPSTVKSPGVDASVPINGMRVPTNRPPQTKPKPSPILPHQPSNSDSYVPVISVGSITPDDPMIVPMPLSPSTTTSTAGSVSPISSLSSKLSSIPNETPKPVTPDAAPSFPFQATKVQIVTGPTAAAPVVTHPTNPSSSHTSHTNHHHPSNSDLHFNNESNLNNLDTYPHFTPAPIPSTLTPDLNMTPNPLHITPSASSSNTPHEIDFSTTTTRPKLPLVMDKSPCGRLNSSTDPKYPWVAAIKLGQKYICAGSVIDEYHILTSAACVSHLSTIDIGKLRVYLGERILNSNMDGPTIVRKVVRAMRHRGFSVTTLRHDIALLKLSLPIPIGTKRVKPVCLPLEDDEDLMVESCGEPTIVGWGLNWNKVEHDVTHESRLALWTKDACLDKYRFFIPDTHFDDEDMICAQHMETNAKILETRKEDVESDGSPLIVKGASGIYQQIGISSWKLGPLSTFPRVLTRVTAYRHWIEKNRLRP